MGLLRLVLVAEPLPFALPLALAEAPPCTRAVAEKEVFFLARLSEVVRFFDLKTTLLEPLALKLAELFFLEDLDVFVPALAEPPTLALALPLDLPLDFPLPEAFALPEVLELPPTLKLELDLLFELALVSDFPDALASPPVFAEPEA